MNTDERPNPDRSLEALKAQLRALPRPPVPAGLEARLLAAVPATLRTSPRHKLLRAAVLVIAAAACVVGMIAWQPRPDTNQPTTPGQGSPPHRGIEWPSFDSTRIAALQEARQWQDEEKLPAFTWPVDESAALRPLSPFPADLLE